MDHSCIQASLGGDTNEIVAGKWKRIDLRNKDDTRPLRVNIRLVSDKQEVFYPNWKCTQLQFVMRPLAKKCIFVCVDQSVIDDVMSKMDPQKEDSLPSIDLYLDQFAGIGRQVTAAVKLRPINTGTG